MTATALSEDAERLNHFERLGLPAQFDVDPAALESRYLGLSAELHPDRFAEDDDPRRKMLALRLSAALNDAYRTLKEPFARGEYLLALRGGQTSEQDRRTPPGFIEEMLELRETVDDALASGRAADAERLVPELTRRRDELLARLPGQFAAGRLPDVRLTLNAANYFRKVLAQIRDAALGR
jgi:molecular chaperone HscB